LKTLSLTKKWGRRVVMRVLMRTIKNNVDEKDFKNEAYLNGQGQEMMDDEGSGEVFGKKSELDNGEQQFCSKRNGILE
jgi:hypothetical protein